VHQTDAAHRAERSLGIAKATRIENDRSSQSTVKSTLSQVILGFFLIAPLVAEPERREETAAALLAQDCLLPPHRVVHLW
jgi:hypothetical protein